jgi:hypothetical protein
MFAQSLAEVLPRIRQRIDTKNIMVTIFFTQRKRIVLDVLPKGSKFSQLYFIDYMFPDSKRVNLNFSFIRQPHHSPTRRRGARAIAAGRLVVRFLSEAVELGRKVGHRQSAARRAAY